MISKACYCFIDGVGKRTEIRTRLVVAEKNSTVGGPPIVRQIVAQSSAAFPQLESLFISRKGRDDRRDVEQL